MRAAILLLLLSPRLVFAQTDQQKAFAKQFEKAVKKNNVTLRIFDGRSELGFHADGSPSGTGKVGSWTLNSKVQGSGVKLKRDALIIDGTRLWAKFEEKTGNPIYVRSPSDVRIRIEIQPNEQPEQIKAAI